MESRVAFIPSSRRGDLFFAGKYDSYGSSATFIAVRGLSRALPKLALVVPQFTRTTIAPSAFVRYAGAFDLDGFDTNSAEGASAIAELRAWLERTDGASIDDACARFTQLQQARQAAQRIAGALESSGAEGVLVYFTGMKGFRVLFRHPAAYRRVEAGSKIGAATVQEVLEPLATAEAVAGAGAMLDRSIYDVEKGLKPDVRPHPKTGLWPTRGRLARDPGSPADPALVDAIVAHWTWVCASAPEVEDAPALEGAGVRCKRKREDEEETKLGPAPALEQLNDAAGTRTMIFFGPRDEWAQFLKKGETSSAHFLEFRAKFGAPGYYRFKKPDGGDPTRELLRRAGVCLVRKLPYFTHQVISKELCRLFFDVDGVDEGRKWNSGRLVEEMQQALAELGYDVATLGEAWVCDSEERCSPMIVFPRIVHATQDTKRVAEAVARRLKSRGTLGPYGNRATIDTGVYGTLKMRLLGARKRERVGIPYLGKDPQGVERKMEWFPDGGRPRRVVAVIDGRGEVRCPPLDPYLELFATHLSPVKTPNFSLGGHRYPWSWEPVKVPANLVPSVRDAVATVRADALCSREQAIDLVRRYVETDRIRMLYQRSGRNAANVEFRRQDVDTLFRTLRGADPGIKIKFTNDGIAVVTCRLWLACIVGRHSHPDGDANVGFLIRFSPPGPKGGPVEAHVYAKCFRTRCAEAAARLERGKSAVGEERDHYSETIVFPLAAPAPTPVDTIPDEILDAPLV
eukprot:tig00020553_g10523.t1